MIGCSRQSAVPKDIVATAESSYEQALAMINSKSYSEALTLLDKALGEGGGLNADMVTDAYVARARCHAELGNLDKAQADINEAEKGTGDLANLLLVQGILAMKKGDDATAQSNFSRAREINPEIKTP
jgi:tetratricopeptide (TPR) repeat protein